LGDLFLKVIKKTRQYGGGVFCFFMIKDNE